MKFKFSGFILFVLLSTVGYSYATNLLVDDELKCLALNIYHESRGEGGVGMLSVGLVTLNRQQHIQFPDTICQVVYQGRLGSVKPARLGSRVCQFSWYCDGKSDFPKNTASWNDAYKIAAMLYFLKDYRTFDVTNSASHYHNLTVRPRWIKDKGMTFVKRIGKHRFYRWETR